MSLRKSSVCFTVLIALVAGIGMGAVPASCDCTDTCGTRNLSLPFCWEYGSGRCTQGTYNTCQSNVCGGWAPWKDDCMEVCEWTNFMCVTGGPCERVTSHDMACVPH